MSTGPREDASGSSESDSYPIKRRFFSVWLPLSVLWLFAVLAVGVRAGDQPLFRELSEPSSPGGERWRRVVSRFDRVVTSLALTPRLGSSGHRIVCLGAGYSLGFGRLNGGVSGLGWHDVGAMVLDVSLLPVRTGERFELPLIVVTQKRRNVVSSYYEYDLVERTLSRKWSYRHVWIYRSGGGWLGQPIGLADPLRNPPSPVQLGVEGWDWLSKTGESLPGATLPVAIRRLTGRLYRLHPSGHLEYFEHGNRVAQSSLRFGGSPLQVAPRRGKDEVDLHPGILVLNPGSGQERVLAVRNVEVGWGLFSSFRSFSHARLYLTSRRGGDFEVTWESERVPGRVTLLTGDDTGGWMVIRPPNREKSVLHRLDTRVLNP